MASIGKNLKRLRKGKDITQEQLGDYLGVTKSFISQVENDISKLTDSQIIKLNHFFNTDITKQSLVNEENLNKDTVKIIQLPYRKNVRASAGGGCYCFDEMDLEFYEIPAEVAKKIDVDNSDVLDVYGNSMSPTIVEGDKIVVDKSQQSIIDGKVYVIREDERIMVKRVQKLANEIRIISDNKDYPPYNLKDTDDWNICGRVAGLIREL